MGSDEDDIISSLYPPPPPYYKFFTRENLDKLKAWRREKGEEGEEQGEEGNEEERMQIDGGDGHGEDRRHLVVPPGPLQFLEPPRRPEGEHYRGFGNIWSFEDRLPSLKESGWVQLYQDDDEQITSKTKIRELHKLLNSLLLNFLELIGVMSIEPLKFHLKIEDLKLILININHILNTYRPHQSRESLIMLLRKQIEQKRGEIDRIDKESNEIKQKILTLVSLDGVVDGGGKLAKEDETTLEFSLRKAEAIQQLLQQEN